MNYIEKGKELRRDILKMLHSIPLIRALNQMVLFPLLKVSESPPFLKVVLYQILKKSTRGNLPLVLFV